VSDIKIVGYYVNEKLGSLYIISSYYMDRVKHIGLLECKVFKNEVKVALLDYVSSDKMYSSTRSKGFDIASMKLYDIKGASLIDLDLAYSEYNRIVDFSRNRVSTSLQDFTLKDSRLYKVRRRSVLKHNELIILEHIVREEFKLDNAIWLCFIVAGLSVVNEWSA
jgi:hypothetical protein